VRDVVSTPCAAVFQCTHALCQSPHLLYTYYKRRLFAQSVIYQNIMHTHSIIIYYTNIASYVLYSKDSSVQETIRSEAVSSRQYFYNRANRNRINEFFTRSPRVFFRARHSRDSFLRISFSIIELCNNLICALGCISNNLNQKLYFLTLFNIIVLSRTRFTETSNKRLVYSRFSSFPLWYYIIIHIHLDFFFLLLTWRKLYLKKKKWFYTILVFSNTNVLTLNLKLMSDDV